MFSVKGTETHTLDVFKLPANEVFLMHVNIMCPLLLYIGSNIIFGFFFWRLPPFLSLLSYSTRAKEAWHSPENLSQSWAAGIWGSSLQFSSTLTAPFLLPPLLILPFYFQPASQYNTEEPCAANTLTHTPLGVHTHAHFYKPLKRQDQRRKEKQTPLRCSDLASCATWHRRLHTR